MRSNAHTLLTVFVRVVAIAYFCSAIVQLPVWYMTIGMDVDDAALWRALMIATPVITLVVCACLWLFADVLVRWALARPDGATFESSLDATDWQRIGFSAVGAWFAISGLVSLVQLGGSWIYMQSVRDDYPDTDVRLQLLPDLFASVTQLATGVALLLGARGLVLLLERMRGR